MAADKAVEFFHGREKYNCVQAVLKAFEKDFKVTEEQIVSASRKGAGRAENGLCGALYAARLLVKEEGLKMELNSAFEEKAGAIQCRQIRKLNKLNCRECVRLAAQKVCEIIVECV